MNNHQLLDGICLCYEFGLADDVRAVRSGDGVWFVRLCQLLTGQPMLAAVLVLLSSTPCSPGTARGRNRRRCGHHWAVPFRAGGLRSGQGAGQDRMVLDGAWRWWSTSSSRALCLRQGSVARRQWPAPKPQLVAPGPVQYRRGGIRTLSATPGPPTARTNAPPSSPHPATTRSLRGRVIWSTGLRWGHSTRTGTFPYPRGHAARTGTGFLHPLTSNASVRA